MHHKGRPVRGRRHLTIFPDLSFNPDRRFDYAAKLVSVAIWISWFESRRHQRKSSAHSFRDANLYLTVFDPGEGLRIRWTIEWFKNLEIHSLIQVGVGVLN